MAFLIAVDVAVTNSCPLFSPYVTSIFFNNLYVFSNAICSYDALATVVGVQHGSVHCKHFSIESYASSVGGQLTDARAEGSL